jgi:hypothetical protein
MKTRVVVSIEIQAPKERVFLYLQELKLHYLWNASLRKLEPESALIEGSRYTAYSSLLGKEVKAVNQVTRLQAPDVLTLANKIGPIHYVITYHLGPNSAGTKLTCNCDIESNVTIFPYAAPLLEMLAHNRIETDFEALKIVVENEVRN